MKKITVTIVSMFILAGLYLLFWPVPIDPVRWDAPTDAGYTGAFAPNTDLTDLEHLSIGDTYGPEDVDSLDTPEGVLIYASGHQGEIIEINPRTKTSRILVRTGGVPLGVEFGPDRRLYVADAYKGLLAVTLEGKMTSLTDRVNGTPILYADDLDIGPDGVIYFSDASTQFGAKRIGSTLGASLLEIIEHRGTGRVLSYNPTTKITRVVKDNMVFPNGVVVSADGQSILVNETGNYNVHRIFIDGPRKGQSEILIDNLPGFPDNINAGPVLADGRPTYLLGLISQRSKWLDDNAGNINARKLALRLPARLRPQAVSYGLIVQIDDQGTVLRTWQDPSGTYPDTTGAIIAPDGYMYVSSLSAPTLGRLKLSD